MKCSIYLTDTDKKRHKVKVIFQKIKMSAINLNILEILNNKIAGNIDFCYVYKNTYQFNLYGGYIEIKTKQPPTVKVYS